MKYHSSYDTATRGVSYVKVHDPTVRHGIDEYVTEVEDIESFRAGLPPWIDAQEITHDEYERCAASHRRWQDSFFRTFALCLRASGLRIQSLDYQTIRRIISYIEAEVKSDIESKKSPPPRH